MDRTNEEAIIELDRLLRAAIDQPRPTRKLRVSVNRLLDLLDHDLRLKRRGEQ